SQREKGGVRSGETDAGKILEKSMKNTPVGRSCQRIFVNTIVIVLYKFLCYPFRQREFDLLFQPTD
ncbi:MAG: hypothetical protein KHW76_13850, partial [Oscillibacter sp.]|nr:hypothetical protein [Oscillibacter sp.]